MLKADYEKAVTLSRESIDSGHQLTVEHTKRAGLPFDAVKSLRRQMLSRHIRKLDWQCKQPNRVEKFLRQYQEGTKIMDIAQQPGLRYSPYLMARILLAALEPEVKVAQAMQETDLISDDRLRREVQECLAEDMDYSPHMDRLRRGIGAEYEFILQQKLSARGIAFESESDLREKGAYKTPDFLLQVPMSVQGSRNEWTIVSWVDSKAMFGDEHTYVKEHQSQLLSYVNRYGPGLVIYWFGFVETLVSFSFDGFQKDIMVAAEFPSPIMLPDGQMV